MQAGTIVMLGFVLCIYAVSGFLLYKSVSLANKKAVVEIDEIEEEMLINS